MQRNLEQGFETLVRWLEPLPSEHQKAASHRGSVQSCMQRNFNCTNFFETGSFGNGTGVRHYSDTDYFARCPDENLYSNSASTLRKIKESLQFTFFSTAGIEVKTPAVRIPFGIYASERLELTPASFSGTVETPVGKKYLYEIPDYDGGWMKSSPGAHNAYVDRENNRLGGKLKPLIQIVKAWKFYNSVPITSFYLELYVTKYAEAENTIIYDIDLRNVIKILYEKSLQDVRDPMGISGLVSACKTAPKRSVSLSKLATAYSRSEKAYAAREDDVQAAFYWLNLLFNSKFPSR